MYYDAKEATMTKECTSVVGHFDGHGGAPEQYSRHHPMKHLHGYPGGHWTPPLGNYLLHIALAATRATANDTTTKKWTNFDGQFDGCSGAPVRYCARFPMEEIKGLGKSHWTLPSGKYCGQ
jgi:hypothetical protein